MYICLATMGFTVDRYLPLPTLTMSKVLHLAKKESHRLTAEKHVTYNISLTSANWIIKYDLWLKCTSIHCGCPQPGSGLIVPVLSIFY